MLKKLCVHFYILDLLEPNICPTFLTHHQLYDFSFLSAISYLKLIIVSPSINIKVNAPRFQNSRVCALGVSLFHFLVLLLVASFDSVAIDLFA